MERALYLNNWQQVQEDFLLSDAGDNNDYNW
jgi:hypothetical protein